MLDDRLTEAAQRSLQTAAVLARKNQAATVEAVHLLWAQWLGESRAAEILVRFGVNRQWLDDCCPLNALPTLEQSPSADVTVSTLPLSEPVQTILVEAKGRAAQTGRQVQAGSEHLLWALATVESEVKPLLEERGIHSLALEESLSNSSGHTTDPLPVDLELEQTGEPTPGRTDVLRLLDAAANRAREGLRVVEDFVRFVLDDAFLTERCKTCRHRLQESLAAVGYAELISARDTGEDVGTRITTPTERQRKTSLEVVRAGFKRVQEAVRSLEEYGKVLSPQMGEALEAVRYELYTLEKAVLTTHESRRRLEGRALYLLATGSLCPAGLETTVRQALAAGVGVVQLREKDLPDRQLVQLGRQVRRWTRDCDALFIMNDRPDLAVLCDADGVHAGQDELTVHQARRIIGPDRLVGVSTHTIEQARRAVLDGADYLGVGPVFASGTKAFDSLAGLEFVRQVAAEITLPWYAIGGIDADKLFQVIEAGATRIAVSGAICRATDSAAAVTALLERLAVK